MSRDPAALLILPVLGSGAAANLSPAFEQWANIVIGVPLVGLAVGTVGRLVWLWWGPLPDVDRNPRLRERLDHILVEDVSL